MLTQRRGPVRVTAHGQRQERACPAPDARHRRSVGLRKEGVRGLAAVRARAGRSPRSLHSGTSMSLRMARKRPCPAPVDKAASACGAAGCANLASTQHVRSRTAACPCDATGESILNRLLAQSHPGATIVIREPPSAPFRWPASSAARREAS